MRREAGLALLWVARSPAFHEEVALEAYGAASRGLADTCFSVEPGHQVNWTRVLRITEQPDTVAAKLDLEGERIMVDRPGGRERWWFHDWRGLQVSSQGPGPVACVLPGVGLLRLRGQDGPRLLSAGMDSEPTPCLRAPSGFTQSSRDDAQGAIFCLQDGLLLDLDDRNGEHPLDWEIENRLLSVVAKAQDGARMTVRVGHESGSGWGLLYEVDITPALPTSRTERHQRRFLPTSMLADLDFPRLDSVIRNCLLDLLVKCHLTTIPNSILEAPPP